MSTLSGLCLSARNPQSHNWDCGFALLRWCCAPGVLASECSLNKLRTSSAHQVPASDVDLAYVLHASGVFRFTATMGVDPAYKHEAFYQRSRPIRCA